jgi:hypothetical protein
LSIEISAIMKPARPTNSAKRGSGLGADLSVRKIWLRVFPSLWQRNVVIASLRYWNGGIDFVIIACLAREEVCRYCEPLWLV